MRAALYTLTALESITLRRSRSLSQTTSPSPDLCVGGAPRWWVSVTLSKTPFWMLRSLSRSREAYHGHCSEDRFIECKKKEHKRSISTQLHPLICRQPAATFFGSTFSRRVLKHQFLAWKILSRSMATNKPFSGPNATHHDRLPDRERCLDDRDFRTGVVGSIEEHG